MKQLFKHLRLICLLGALTAMAPVTRAQLVHWGLSAGTHLPFHTEIENADFHSLEKNNFNFGLQLKVGHRLHGQTGILYFVNNHNMTETKLDSTTDLQANYLGIPLQVGLNLINGEEFKLRITGGIEYRMLVWVSPNDLEIKKSDLTTNNADMFGGAGISLGKFTFDVLCKHPFTPVLKDAEKSKISCWLNMGFFF